MEKPANNTINNTAQAPSAVISFLVSFVLSLSFYSCVFFVLLFLFAPLFADPADFARDPVLPTFYNILSTNEDKKGLPFVSSIEGIKYPFWATQWHAERTQFEWYGTRRGETNILSARAGRCCATTCYSQPCLLLRLPDGWCV